MIKMIDFAMQCANIINSPNYPKLTKMVNHVMMFIPSVSLPTLQKKALHGKLFHEEMQNHVETNLLQQPERHFQR